MTIVMCAKWNQHYGPLEDLSRKMNILWEIIYPFIAVNLFVDKFISHIKITLTLIMIICRDDNK